MPLHPGVPATGLVSEVDPSLEHLAHRDDGHAVTPPVRFFLPGRTHLPKEATVDTRSGALVEKVLLPDQEQ